MTQLFQVHSVYGLMTIVAAIDAGLVPDAQGPRILISANTAMVPETAPDLHELDYVQSLLSRFDRVESLNAVLDPVLPTKWNPPEDHLPMLERLLRNAWGVGSGIVEFFTQSPQVAPAKTMLRIFAGGPVSIIGDGLMTYSPIRDRMPRSIISRVVAVIYADVVPGVAPVLFTEVGAARVPVPVPAFAAVMSEAADGIRDPRIDALAGSTAPTALVLGQYLAALGLVTGEEELAMQREMLTMAYGWGAERVVFKPHPSAPPTMAEALRAYAEALGMQWALYTGDVPAEILAERLGVIGVAAGFSTALPTARALHGTPIGSVGTQALLRRLTPHQNSNRMPVTLIDAITRVDGAYADPARLQQLVDTMGYYMQPWIMSASAPGAESFLASLDPMERHRYFGTARLTELGLPGGADSIEASLQFAASSRREQLRLTARGAKRRLGRAWKELKGS